MGSRERGIIFRQSLNDFPCTIELGKKEPSWRINRWRDGLRFIPFDDEGFTLRGNRRQLLYKGRKHSHRFTILNDGSFEYDCILKKEPDTNVISLLMEGAEKYDFFRQPDFVPDPFLKGSYAVYNKETLNGEGTGKLCHINRPLIIDARGRKVWGDLSIVNNELRITIPEQWLSEAKYPVLVDPTIGTTTVGSLTEWIPPGERWPQEIDTFCKIIVNRFILYEGLNSLCTGYYYSDKADEFAGGIAVAFNDIGDTPYQKKSRDENFVDFYEGDYPSWRSTTFNCGSFTFGSYIWFGLRTLYQWFPRFDFGGKCYSVTSFNFDNLPDIYPIDDYPKNYELKLSMYFTYTQSQSFIRTITQGVSLIDTKYNTVGNIRKTIQTVGITDTNNKVSDYTRKLSQNINVSSFFIRFSKYYKQLFESINVKDIISRCKEYIYLFLEIVGNTSDVKKQTEYFRIQNEMIKLKDIIIRHFMLFVKINTTSFVRDFVIRRFLVAREQIVLKSCITREIILESRIN